MAQTGTVTTLIPARLDRLPWSRFHTRLVTALGVAWILDGLEITFASNFTTNLQSKASLGLSSRAASDVASWYLGGEVIGALLFGRLSDRFGRKNLFVYTLGLYLVANGIAAFSMNIYWLDACRVLAGMGIGGEYAAINSAIDELIPSKHRGRVDIAVNGTYWSGAAIAALAGVYLLDPSHVSDNLGWRVTLLIGPALGGVVWFVRRTLPESPRWLITHGRAEEAERNVKEIEDWVRSNGHELADVDQSKEVEIDPSRSRPSLWGVTKVLLADYPRRSLLGATLMITQSFLYNAIFFTYALVLTKVYNVPEKDAPYYFIFFAVGNLAGPLLIGRFFDSIGRKQMIAGTYVLSGVLLLVSAILFRAGALDAIGQTICWCVIFFFASAGASAAYLTVSEIFPVEVRAKAIAVFFAIAQSFGAMGPWLYGLLIGTGHDHTKLFYGYLIG
ncbi:MAG TPA: MFS transporter, partial [Mycobacteriales bacterium]|nr:MFS transporter [Mycobacteriales bacterium]